MCFAAADALAEQTGDKLSADHILPSMDDWEVFAREAAAVGMKAQEQGVAGLSMSYDDLFHNARQIIERSRRLTKTMMDEGLIAAPPEDRDHEPGAGKERNRSLTPDL
jgi:malate dehydrogenase (oxaloacetate-decarboxylating)